MCSVKVDKKCSFCGRSSAQVQRLIAGPNVYICNECVELFNDTLKDEQTIKCHELVSNIPTPAEIMSELDKFIVGQTRTKKVMSVAVYNHYKRVAAGAPKNQDIEKSNILMLGPTGCGKTLIARTLAKFLDVPFAIADATPLTEAGYVGEDVENILLRLIQSADYDIEKAEKGIIYLDEVDKISKKGPNVSITRDVSGEGVQQALLTILEGTTANVPPQGGRKHPYQEFIKIDTSNILFIAGGAFDNLEEIIRNRTQSSVMGFGKDVKGKSEERIGEILAKVTPYDLVQYGLIPEFIGRFPVVTTLDDLNEEDLVRIMTEPQNSIIKQYQKLLQLDNITLEFEKEALAGIAKKAMKNGTGARALKSVVEQVMLDLMFELPSMQNVKEVIITGETVEKRGNPIIALRESA
ncbi:MAG: ATP-dependent Clp protease ATP-binding subunit ClpX [Thermotogota bacterium]|nr:ATP-dependent Clp protease ATP-binding subunit ClpX [Thermotogota bacterium]